MKRVIDYVLQDKKTVFHDERTGVDCRLIGGQNCVPEAAYAEFMATKHQYGGNEFSSRPEAERDDRFCDEDDEEYESAMTEQMKLRDMTPWKIRLKWIAAGAILRASIILAFAEGIGKFSTLSKTRISRACMYPRLAQPASVDEVSRLRPRLYSFLICTFISKDSFISLTLFLWAYNNFVQKSITQVKRRIKHSLGKLCPPHNRSTRATVQILLQFCL